MRSKKNCIFSIRFDCELNRVVRSLSFNNNISAGSLIRRIVRSYLVSKGYLVGSKK